MTNERALRLKIVLGTLLLLFACSSDRQRLLDRAISLEAEKRHTEAIVIYNQLVHNHPDHPTIASVQLKIADIHAEQLHNSETALKLYQDVLKNYSDPKVQEIAFSKRGALYRFLKQWDLAIENYTQAFKVTHDKEKQGEYQYQIALLHHYRKDLKQAHLELENYLKQYPQHPRVYEAHFLLGEVYFRNHQFAKAQTHYKAATHSKQQEGFVIEAKYNLALSLEQLGEWDEALEIYHALLKTHPHPPMIKAQLKRLKKLRQEAGRG